MKNKIKAFLLCISLFSGVAFSAQKMTPEMLEQQNAISVYLNSKKQEEIAKSILIFEKYSSSNPRMLYYFGLANIENKTRLLNLSKELGNRYIEQASVLGEPEAKYFIAMEKIKSGDIKTGVSELKVAALKNEKKSQYQLGKMYFQGNGVPLNKKNGFKLIEASAKNNYADAQYDLAKIYFSQKDIKTQKGGLYWLRASVKNGRLDACKDLYKIYENGIMVEKNIYLHKKYLSCSVLNNDEEAISLLAKYHETGKYFKKDLDLANYYNKKLVEFENPEGSYKYAIYTLNKFPKNTVKIDSALMALKKVSVVHLNSAMLLGRIYKEGLFSQIKDNREAIRYFKEAKALGSDVAAREIILLLN
tara:strand:+ start:21419 stop:22501 length:1083 start_codon:yes stop_codon:yes gene_type:complete